MGTAEVKISDMINKILNIDALTGMREMPDKSVHCVVTSPPYWNLRDYGVDGQLGMEATPELFIEKMVQVTGRKCLEQFGKFNRATSWAKTFAALLIGTGEWFSTRCNLTWKLRATKSSRFYFQLSVSMPHTEGIGYGLLLKTPCAMDGKVSSGKKNPKPGDSGTLAQEIMSGYAPTMKKLSLIPTPTASIVGKTSLLNPLFVAEMMGFPPDWLELPFQNTETKV